MVTDLAEVCGQEAAKRALEVAAAGGHSLLLVGPAGAGKSILARCMPGLLPSSEGDAPRPVRSRSPPHDAEMTQAAATASRPKVAITVGVLICPTSRCAE